MNPQKKLIAGLTLLALAQLASAQTVPVYWVAGSGTKNWDTLANWNTTLAGGTAVSSVPTTGNTAQFSTTGTLATTSTLSLNGNRAIDGLIFNNSNGTVTTVASTLAGQILSLGTGGIAFGTGQVNMGGSGAASMVVALMGSQTWTGSGANLIQFNVNSTSTTQTITNGTSGAVVLTFAGSGTNTKSIVGAIDDGSLGGTTALVANFTGGFGNLNLNGTNLYSGGTTFTQGFISLNNAAALGTGALTINGSALSASVFRSFTTSVVGGVTLNNNAQNWNQDFTLISPQNINFGTGAITLGANTIIRINTSTLGTNALNYTFGGNISGAFSLSPTTGTAAVPGTLPGITAELNLSGTNSYTGGTTIASGLVNFVNTASIPTTGQVTLSGGAIAVGTGTAFANLAAVVANANVTRTSGSFALTGDSSENFAPANGNLLLGAALGSVVKYTGTLTPSGTAYSIGGGGGTIVFTNNNAFTGALAVNMSGGINANLGGGGTVIITGQNNFTGNGTTGLNVGTGTLQVSSINSVTGGTATSNLGAPSSIANGTINIGSSGFYSQLRYTGVGETTDRTINFGGFSGGTFGLDASGSGAVVYNGAYSQASSSTNHFLTLRGINTDANKITAGIGTQLTGNASSINVTKQQRGNWTLTGADNFSTLAINGGTITADYASNTVFSTTTPTLTLGGGSLVIKGNASTPTAQTIGNLTLTASTGQSGLTVNGNGAGSANLTVGNTWTRNAGTYLNVNLLNGGVVTSSPTLTNGIFGGGGITVTDSSGTDFATVNTGQIAKLNSSTALVASGGAATTNYLLSGNQTLTGTVLANTVRIDTSSTGGTLTLGANNITNTTTEYLMSGANDYTISGSLGASGTTVGLDNYGTGKLTLSSTVTSGAGVLNKTGPGLVDLNVAQTYTGATNVLGGVLRVSSTIGTGNVMLNTGGIYEIATATTFNRTVGTGASQVQWGNGDGGFSAYGGNRTVALTNALGVTTGQLVWGSTSGNNFVTAPNASPAFVKDGFALLLSSSTSDSTIDFQNPIDLVNMPRAIVVGNGTAAVDAILSGVLSSSDYSGGIDKSGAGTLALTAHNTYTGQTRVLAGQLNLGINNAVSSSSNVVLAGGTLQSAFNQSLGTLNLSASSVLDLSTGGVFAFADSSTQSWTGTLSIVGTFVDDSSVRFGTSSGGLTSGQLAQITINGQAAAIDGSGYLMVSAIPEPATYAALFGLAGLAFAVVRRRRKVS